MNDPEPAEAKFSAKEAALKQAAEAYCALIGYKLAQGVYAATSYYFTVGTGNTLFRAEKEGGRGGQLVVGECPALSGGTLGNLFQRAVAATATEAEAKWTTAYPPDSEGEGE
jgi:hypothetical protein